MKMDAATAKQIFDELFSSLEDAETKCMGLLEFLKGKGIATDEELAPYLEGAGRASSVRWLAARVRMEYLLSSAKPSEKNEAKETEKKPESIPAAEPRANTSKTGENAEGTKKIDDDSTTEVRTGKSIEQDRDHDTEFKAKSQDAPSGNAKPNNSEGEPENEAATPAVQDEGH
jgi:hypothetical protein